MEFNRRSILKMLGLAPLAPVVMPEASAFDAQCRAVLSEGPFFTYQWLRNGVPITGANSSFYTATEADLGCSIDVCVTATNAHGSTIASENAGTVLDERGTKLTLDVGPLRLPDANALADADRAEWYGWEEPRPFRNPWYCSRKGLRFPLRHWRAA